MNRFTKKQVLIGALILLFVINLAALGAIIYQNYQHKWNRPSFPGDKTEWSEQDRGNRSRRKGKDEWADKKDSLQRKGEQQEGRGFEYFIKKRLQLDQKQFEKFQTLHDENVESMKEIAQELGQKRDTLMRVLAKEDPDSSKMNRLAIEIGNLHTQLKKNTIDHFTKIKEFCRPEQKEELNKMIMEMSQRGRPEPGSGVGPGNRGRNKMKRK